MARRCPATLEMAEHDVSCLLPCELLELPGARGAEPSEPLRRRRVTFGDQRDFSTDRHSTLGDHDDAESGAELFALAQSRGDEIQVERNLGDQNHVCPACYSRVQRDPPGVAAHYLDH